MRFSRLNEFLTPSLVLTVTGAVLGSFPFGYNLGSINAPESLIRSFIQTTQSRRDGKGFSEDVLTTVWALTASIFAVGGCVGAAAGGWWATTFGRRNGSQLASGLGVLAGILMGTCRAARSYELIILGRFIVGIQCGLFTTLTPLYLAEISSVQTRGALGVLHQLALVTGMLAAQILGFPVLLGTERSWHILLGLTAVPSVVQAMILPFCPESPCYLLTVKKDQAGCRGALESLRASRDVDTEMEVLTTEKHIKSQQMCSMTIVQLLRDASLRRPLLVGVVLHLAHQVNGIPGVFFYSTRLFQNAGLTESEAKYTTSGLGVVMVTMGVLTVPLMDRVGRRSLLLTGLAGMAVTGGLVTVTLTLREFVEGFDVLSIFFILVFVVFFAVGPAPVPWLIVPELFTHDARSAAVAVCVLVNWLGNFLVGFGFPLLQVWLQDFVFLPFTAALVFFFTFVYFTVPETKGKSFQEISALMSNREPGLTSPTDYTGLKPRSVPGPRERDTDLDTGDNVDHPDHPSYGSTDSVTRPAKVS